jgi:DNA-binding transcriptional LysR family regulator
VKKLYIRQVEAFRAVMSLGSMSKAAELMGISQPAVSRLIADFQEIAGFQLFNRKRYSAEPTADARQLFAQVEKMFHGLEELGQELLAIRNMHSGRLTLSATSSYSTGILPELIATFKAQHPGMSIALHVHPHEQVIDWVSSGRSDIGFCIQPVANSNLNVRTLAKQPAHCIMPLGHPLAAKETLQPSDLADLPFVSFPRGSALRFQIDSFFDRLGVERSQYVEATSHQAVCALVSAGIGVALTNPFAPIDGYPVPLVALPMKPSVMIELQMVWNDSSRSVSSSSFSQFVTEGVAKRFGEARAAISQKARRNAHKIRE